MPSASLTAGIASASLATGLVSAGVGAAGAISSAQANSANANYQAQVAKNNAITANQNAEYATQAGQEKAQEQSLKAREQQGAVTTALAANGLDVNSGTPADVEKTERETGELGTEQTVDLAALQAYGYRTQSTNFAAESGLQTAEAGQASTAGAVSATGGLLGSASSLGSNYARFQLAGLYGNGSGAQALSDINNPEAGGAAPAGGLT